MKDHATHVVVVGRQQETYEQIDRCLTGYGYQVSAATGAAALSDLLDRNPPDLIVLDIPTIHAEESGWLRRSLAANRQPIIALISGMGEFRPCAELAFAADDCLAKPLDPIELLLRIRAALNGIRDHAEPLPQYGHALRFDRWALLDGQRRLRAADGSEVRLSPCELALLKAFLAKPGQILSREQLLELTVGRDADVFDRNIDNLVRRLRKKIEIDPASPIMIRTHWRHGYRFAATVWSGPPYPPAQAALEFTTRSH